MGYDGTVESGGVGRCLWGGGLGGSLGYDEGCNPERMKSQEGKDGSHDRTGVAAVVTGLLLNAGLTCGN